MGSDLISLTAVVGTVASTSTVCTSTVSTAMVWSSWSAVGRVLATGVALYASMVVILRVSGKRTLAKLNAFDLVVTVALGSVLATVVVSREVSWFDALSAVGVLVLCQYLVALGTAHLSWMHRFAKADPTTLVVAGELLHHELKRVRVAPDEICQVVRAAGYGGLDQIAAVVLETDGSLSVIPTDDIGDRSALPPDTARPPDREP